eukprot:3349502-Karenia_brevis.AAC.1
MHIHTLDAQVSYALACHKSPDQWAGVKRHVNNIAKDAKVASEERRLARDAIRPYCAYLTGAGQAQKAQQILT